MTPRVPCLAACLAMLAVAAPAQRKESAWDLLSRRYDENGDGTITKEEYPRGAEKFARLDANGDGRLTKKDFIAGLRRATIFFRRFVDEDRNGEVSAREWAAFREDCEADEKGRISEDALIDAGVNGRAARFVRKMMDLDGNGEFELKDLDELFAIVDGNGDGKLAGAELRRRRPGGGERPERQKAPRVGETAPDFELPVLGAKVEGSKIRLSSFAGKKPVALVFGSYT